MFKKYMNDTKGEAWTMINMGRIMNDSPPAKTAFECIDESLDTWTFDKARVCISVYVNPIDQKYVDEFAAWITSGEAGKAGFNITVIGEIQYEAEKAQRRLEETQQRLERESAETQRRLERESAEAQHRLNQCDMIKQSLMETIKSEAEKAKSEHQRQHMAEFRKNQLQRRIELRVIKNEHRIQRQAGLKVIKDEHRLQLQVGLKVIKDEHRLQLQVGLLAFLIYHSILIVLLF